MLKRAAKALFSVAGLDVQRKAQSPAHTLLGLKSFPISSVIDVGANEGQFARFVRTHFPSAELYCFEPLPEPFAKLKSWSEGVGGVHVFNVALGEELGVADMYLHSDHSPSSSLLCTTALSEDLYPMTRRQQRVPVDVRTLDDAIGSIVPAPRPDVLVKLDVQGYESRVIRGGRSTLASARACIVEVCLDVLYDGQSTYRELFFELDRLALRYAGNLNQVYAPDGHVVYIDALFIR